MLNLLKRLCLEFGPSGYEGAVREIIIKELEPYSDKFEAYTDALGSYVVHVEAKDKPRLMVCAHTDEVGFMITEICDDGTLRFGNVGGISSVVLPTRRIMLENGIKGAIMSKPIHLQDSKERTSITPARDLYIDIGALNKEDAEKMVSLGDYATFDSEYVEFGNGFIKSKALDDRLGCAIMVQVIKDIFEKKLSINYDLYFAFTTREEVFSAAANATEQIKPDYGFIIESTAVGDIANAPKKKLVASLGQGGAFSFADLMTIYDKGFTDKLIELCKKHEIPYQVKEYVSGGNDASKLQTGARGAKVAVMSAPSRYIHSASSVVSKADLESIYKTLYHLICEE